MGEMFERAFTQQRLLDAWKEARDAAYADGEAGAEVERFEAAAARNVSEIADVLASGTYEPKPVHRVEISKSGGGTRRLAIPCLEDRIVERALLAELDHVVDPLLLPWSFAYRKGLGVKDAIAALTEARDEGAQWVARCDIDDCFEHIPRWEVVRRLREAVHDLAVIDLVRKFMDRAVIGERTAYAERGLGLHQGSPLSPLLCNLYLDAFDRAMLGKGYRAIRYADDIAIPVPDRGGAEQALKDAADALHELRLEMDGGKSITGSFGEGVQFLGATVTEVTSPGAAALSHPREVSVYVDRDGALLRSRGERLVVEHQNEELLKLNFKRVRQVVCSGRVGMTTPFIQRAARDGIDVVLLDGHGGPGARIASLAHSDPTGRRAQYRVADDERAAGSLARAFVDGKIANMRVGLLRVGRGAVDPVVAAAAETLAITRMVLADAGSRDEMLGHEGSATREYFRGLRAVIPSEWGFTARERRPPPDPVNAMLSFGYTLLVQEGVAALEMAGLDAAVGFMHQARWGRPCLALDLIEELRPVIVDAVVLRCVTSGVVRFEEFTEAPDIGCRMGDRARQAFLAAYERRMLTVFTHEASGRRVSYRVGLGLQAKALARAVLDPSRGYQPVRWKS